MIFFAVAAAVGAVAFLGAFEMFSIFMPFLALEIGGGLYMAIRRHCLSLVFYVLLLF